MFQVLERTTLIFNDDLTLTYLDHYDKRNCGYGTEYDWIKTSALNMWTMLCMMICSCSRWHVSELVLTIFTTSLT